MQAILEYPARASFAVPHTVPVSDDVADLLSLERKLEELLTSGTFVAPPSLIGAVLLHHKPRIHTLTPRDRVRFEAMLTDVRAALSAYSL
jgi:hypothetical protein